MKDTINIEEELSERIGQLEHKLIDIDNQLDSLLLCLDDLEFMGFHNTEQLVMDVYDIFVKKYFKAFTEKADIAYVDSKEFIKLQDALCEFNDLDSDWLTQEILQTSTMSEHYKNSIKIDEDDIKIL